VTKNNQIGYSAVPAAATLVEAPGLTRSGDGNSALRRARLPPMAADVGRDMLRRIPPGNRK